MIETSGTAFSGLTVALCGCCVVHGVEPGDMTWEVVVCPVCAASCSCIGCVADVQDR